MTAPRARVSGIVGPCNVDHDWHHGALECAPRAAHNARAERARPPARFKLPVAPAVPVAVRQPCSWLPTACTECESRRQLRFSSKLKGGVAQRAQSRRHVRLKRSRCSAARAARCITARFTGKGSKFEVAFASRSPDPPAGRALQSYSTAAPELALSLLASNRASPAGASCSSLTVTRCWRRDVDVARRVTTTTVALASMPALALRSRAATSVDSRSTTL